MIAIESVSLSYQGLSVFSNLDLCVPENHKVLIHGKSGIGKTSLLKSILGFETIDKGKIFINSLLVNPSNIQTIRKQIFYLSQNIDFHHGVVSEILEEILSLNGIEDKKFIKIMGLLDFLELNHQILRLETQDLSGGERQRLGLLTCFLLNRPTWLLDEPTAALDPRLKDKVSQYIIDQDKTMIIISHDEIWKNFQLETLRWE